jgi:hypothetical protein
MSQEREEKLIQEIEKAFLHTTYPGDDYLAYALTRADYWKLMNDFKGNHWKKIPPEILVKHVYDLPLFSPEAFRFYLPAYLLASLRGEPSGDFGEFTYYEFVPPEDEGSDMEYFLKRVEGFDRPQRASIRQFVELFIEADPYDTNGLNARTKKFWENY